ncbi:MAG: NUDIX domain-containing protein [Novosphingobium sp.]|nr:NUDIX domain-containing protein [Novosphingobium sp.]
MPDLPQPSMPQTGPEPKAVIPAATAIIFRHGRDGEAAEILMVQRSRAMRFAGGAAVFPGGRVDPADHALAERLAPRADRALTAARIAAIRETLEETGLAIAVTRKIPAAEAIAARRMLLEDGALAPVLDRFGWALDLEALTPFAHWCPDFHRAFDTRFFLADLGTGDVDIAVDETENTHLFWTSAQSALDKARAGEISVIFPTQRNLERLAQFATFAQAHAHARRTPVRKITPFAAERDGERWLMIPEGLGYPILGEPAASTDRG